MWDNRTTMANKPNRIVGLRWEETSGVDHPANEEEGWLVMKAADSEEDDKDVTDEQLDELIASEAVASDDPSSSKGIGHLIGRLVERVINLGREPAKKYAEVDIAVAIKAKASGFIAELVAIINDKGLSKSEVSKRVIEAVKSLQVAVETELNEEDE